MTEYSSAPHCCVCSGACFHAGGISYCFGHNPNFTTYPGTIPNYYPPYSSYTYAPLEPVLEEILAVLKDIRAKL